MDGAGDGNDDQPVVCLQARNEKLKQDNNSTLNEVSFSFFLKYFMVSLKLAMCSMTNETGRRGSPANS